MNSETGQEEPADNNTESGGLGSAAIGSIANAFGALFGTFTQISSTTQSAQQGQDALLLASAPQRPKRINTELWFFVGMMVLLALVIIFKLLL